MNYDYIIIGGGSAGCILANRLSKPPGQKVLVLEAGRPDYRWNLLLQMPAAATFVQGNKCYDWMVRSQPEPYLNGRRISHAQGKLLGGSSSINGMLFQRGNPLDYEGWAQADGMETWDFAHCLPYFKRLESCLTGEDRFRGEDGPLTLERSQRDNPLASALFAAVQEAGYALSDDINGYRQEGFSWLDRTIHDGQRVSSSQAYYSPAKHRHNLDVKCQAIATKILFEGKRAIGVNYTQTNGLVQKAFANDIILSGGAFNSPQLLQMSGVGNASDLEPLGIKVVFELPGVGENLQDHLKIPIQHACKQPVSKQPLFKWYKKPRIILQWLLRSGPATTNHVEIGGFIRTNSQVDFPNLMVHFLPLAIQANGTLCGREHGYQVQISPHRATSRGSVKIASTNPYQHPKIRFNYLSTPALRNECIEAIQTSRHILAQPAFATFNDGEVTPGPTITSDRAILDWVADHAETAHHPSCTCKMGKDSQAVIDPTSMKVNGLEGLRVVDASVMPQITNGSIYASVAMIAEKAADLILGNTPLPPDPQLFYRREKQL